MKGETKHFFHCWRNIVIQLGAAASLFRNAPTTLWRSYSCEDQSRDVLWGQGLRSINGHCSRTLQVNPYCTSNIKAMLHICSVACVSCQPSCTSVLTLNNMSINLPQGRLLVCCLFSSLVHRLGFRSPYFLAATILGMYDQPLCTAVMCLMWSE